MPCSSPGLVWRTTTAISVEYTNTAHNATPTHHNAHDSPHQPAMIADAEASTFVPATVVRKAKPLAWSVTSAAKRGQYHVTRDHEQDGEDDVAGAGDGEQRLRQPVDGLLVGADGDDAGRHDEREGAGKQRRGGGQRAVGGRRSGHGRR